MLRLMGLTARVPVKLLALALLLGVAGTCVAAVAQWWSVAVVFAVALQLTSTVLVLNAIHATRAVAAGDLRASEARTARATRSVERSVRDVGKAIRRVEKTAADADKAAREAVTAARDAHKTNQETAKTTRMVEKKVDRVGARMLAGLERTRTDLLEASPRNADDGRTPER